MRIARKITLLCLTALAAMAFAATSASAVEPVELTDEHTGASCDPCLVHVVGESELHAGGVFRISTCEDEFLATLDSSGSGFVHHYANVATHAGFDCTRQNCNEVGEAVGESEWDATGAEEVGVNEVALTVRFCLDAKSNPDGTGLHCDAPVHVEEVPADSHHYVFTVEHLCPTPSGDVLVSGLWETEAVADEAQGEDEVEFVHL